MFDLAEEGRNSRFEISARSFERGSVEERRVTEVLGQTYFLIRDREPYELEVYNPATIVERISQERRSPRSTRRRSRSTMNLAELSAPGYLLSEEKISL